MKVTGKDIIDRIAQRLRYEDVLCYDSAIVNKLRSLTSKEVAQLFALGDVIQWHNDKINSSVGIE